MRSAHCYRLSAIILRLLKANMNRFFKKCYVSSGAEGGLLQVTTRKKTLKRGSAQGQLRLMAQKQQYFKLRPIRGRQASLPGMFSRGFFMPEKRKDGIKAKHIRQTGFLLPIWVEGERPTHYQK